MKPVGVILNLPTFHKTILTVEQLLVAFSNQCTYHPIHSPPTPSPIHKQSLCSKPIICTPCIGCPGFNHEIKLWRTWQKYWYILFALAARLSYILKPSKTINKWPLYTCNWMTTRKLLSFVVDWIHHNIFSAQTVLVLGRLWWRTRFHITVIDNMYLWLEQTDIHEYMSVNLLIVILYNYDCSAVFIFTISVMLGNLSKVALYVTVFQLNVQ